MSSRIPDTDAARRGVAAPAPRDPSEVFRDPLPVFAAVGIELEYMIVDARTLDVRAIADRALAELAGHPANDVRRGPLGWSNELAAHVIEVKNVDPSPSLSPLRGALAREIAEMNRLLSAFGARLMPTGMHPWIDPARETRLWPHDDARIYRTFDRLFDCRRHGWANLQSMHINLPFAGDEQFRRLHAAIRAALPLIPALAASSPFADGARQRALDYRLRVYRDNAARMPSIAGRVVPDDVDSRIDYEARILAPMYREIAPHDPGGVLRHEWLNSRGAIARFDRSAIEIRVTDTQECPSADVAIAQAVAALVRALYDERWSSVEAQRAMPTERLVGVLTACTDDADQALIEDAHYLALFGCANAARAASVWARAIRAAGDAIDAQARAALAAIVDRGPLARRIVEAVGEPVTRERLRDVYAQLCDCLARDRLFGVQ
jgi:gamma-glutamyl:cysteine ligase YbdK (ATP-grasp superfamily)